MNPLIQKPHIYKKGKILNLKPLDEGHDKPPRRYVFSASNPTLKQVIDQGNNINQIVGRIYLAIAKINSFFGLSKDLSEKLSKEPSVYNKANTLFKKGGDGEKLEDLKNLLVKQQAEIRKLQQQVEALKRPEDEKPIVRSEVLDFTKKLTEIQDKLSQVIG